MRIVSAALLLLVAASVSPSAAQDQPARGRCGFEGTWVEASGFITVIDAQGRWSTWSGDSTQGPPAAAGWVRAEDELITFDFDGAEHGYGYVWRFEQGCRVLDLRLVRSGGQATQSGFHLRFRRAPAE